MLTESEKHWVERREVSETEWSFYSCINCKWHKRHQGSILYPCCFLKLFKNCPKVTPDGIDYNDALEFSERVAVKLANIHFGTEDCPYCSNHINVNEYCSECKTASTDKRCLACRIKYASLVVEEEMNADR